MENIRLLFIILYMFLISIYDFVYDFVYDSVYIIMIPYIQYWKHNEQ